MGPYVDAYSTIRHLVIPAHEGCGAQVVVHSLSSYSEYLFVSIYSHVSVTTLSPVRLCITKVGSSIEITFRLSWLCSVDICIRAHAAAATRRQVHIAARRSTDPRHGALVSAYITVRAVYASSTVLSYHSEFFLPGLAM